MLIWGLKGKAADFYVLLSNMNEELSYKHLMSELGRDSRGKNYLKPFKPVSKMNVRMKVKPYWTGLTGF